MNKKVAIIANPQNNPPAGTYVLWGEIYKEFER